MRVRYHDKKKSFVVFALIIPILILTPYIFQESQQQIVEKYYRVKITIIFDDIWIAQAQVLRGEIITEHDRFISKIKDRAINTSLDTSRSGNQVRIDSEITFDNLPDSQNIRQAIINYIQNNPQIRDRILYGSLMILENTHHWRNPLPDVILQINEIGDKSIWQTYD